MSQNGMNRMIIHKKDRVIWIREKIVSDKDLNLYEDN